MMHLHCHNLKATLKKVEEWVNNKSAHQYTIFSYIITIFIIVILVYLITYSYSVS